jgi:hypothetical protein
VGRRTETGERILLHDCALVFAGKHISELSPYQQPDGASKYDFVGSHLQKVGCRRAINGHGTILISLCRLPEIHEELQNLLRRTETTLHQLPKPPSSDPFGEVLHLIGAFTRDLSKHLEGTPNADGLLQSISPAQRRFQWAIKATVPEFRPYERKYVTQRSLPAPRFLANEEQEDEDEDDLDEDQFICIDEVFDRAQTYAFVVIFDVLQLAHYFPDSARTRELPDNYPFVVQVAYISSITEQWRDPALNLFEAVHGVLSDRVRDIIANHFGNFGRGGLQQSVQ